MHTSLVTEELDRVSVTVGPHATAATEDFCALPRLEKAGYAAEDRAFLDAVLGERAPSPDAEDAYRAVEMVEACYRAVRSGAPVPLPLDV